MSSGQMSDDGPATRTTCPACGHETAARREPHPGLGDFTLTELETMVRNEWRHRLGQDAYVRAHSRDLVRCLIIFALDPESPVPGETLEFRLWSQVATTQVWGLGMAEIRRELAQLVLAVRDVLESRLSPAEVDAFSRSMDAKLSAALRWPGAVGDTDEVR